MKQKPVTTYTPPHLTIYGSIRTLTQGGGRGNGPKGIGDNGTDDPYGHLSHTPPGNPFNNASGQNAKPGRDRKLFTTP